MKHGTNIHGINPFEKPSVISYIPVTPSKDFLHVPRSTPRPASCGGKWSREQVQTSSERSFVLICILFCGFRSKLLIVCLLFLRSLLFCSLLPLRDDVEALVVINKRGYCPATWSLSADCSARVSGIDCRFWFVRLFVAFCGGSAAPDTVR